MNYDQAKPPSAPCTRRPILRRDCDRSRGGRRGCWAEINCDVCHTSLCMKSNLRLGTWRPCATSVGSRPPTISSASPTWKFARPQHLRRGAGIYGDGVSELAGRSRLLGHLRAVRRCGRRCKHRCGAREGSTRPGGILDGSMEKEVSNGSRHGPLPERIR